MALIVTYDARESLDRCLRRLTDQDFAPTAILVIDNASPQPVDDITERYSSVRLVRMPDNGGPAGGYARALTEFRSSDFDFAWIMDDDCAPAKDALQKQLDFGCSADTTAPIVVLADTVDEDTGTAFRSVGWCGALVPHEIVATVGVPNAELFWWTEDTEYLQWRIPEAGYAVAVCPGAIVMVGRSRASRDKPAWKYYYEARNQVHHRLHVQKSCRVPLPRHSKLRVRTWRATRSVAKLAARATFVESESRMLKLSMVGRGAVDGLRGRLGKTISADSAHRPLPSKQSR
jgi:rhamnopyranosyl-N-acetylglucosaminyl-diphospho-decaprenol beta-1,3/1,4-galactofuranosyltransferase